MVPEGEISLGSSREKDTEMRSEQIESIREESRQQKEKY